MNDFKFFQKPFIQQPIRKVAVITSSGPTFASFRVNQYEFHRTLNPERWNGSSFTLEGREYFLIRSPNDLIGRRFDHYIQLHDADRVNGRHDIMNLLNLMNASERF